MVPTKNAARHLAECLSSVALQTYPPVDVLVIDAASTDETPEIARRYGTLVEADVSMTRARRIGALRASGEFILNLDSDQVLSRRAIQACVETGAEIVALGEHSVGNGILPKINELDRRSINSSWRTHVDPLTGSIRPRFYRRDLLLGSLEQIPDAIIDVRPCPYSEDSLIFMGAMDPIRRVGFVPDSVGHWEVDSLLGYAKKWFTYGRAARAYRGTKFETLISGRQRARLSESFRLGRVPALVLRGLPFTVGRFT